MSQPPIQLNVSMLPSRLLASALLCAGLSVALLAPSAARSEEPTRDWTLRGRVVMSGASTHSDPAGFKIYSGITTELGAVRRIGGPFALELTLRSESREIDRAGDPGTPDVRLGSLELFPIGLAFQYIPWSDTFQPYLGAGLNLTVCWEKTGALDDTQVSPSIGPMLQLGLDVQVTQVLVLNLDLRWNLLRPEVRRAGVKVATLQIDPLTLGAGVGVRF